MVNPLFAVFYNVAATQAFQAALSTACGQSIGGLLGVNERADNAIDDGAEQDVRAGSTALQSLVWVVGPIRLIISVLSHFDQKVIRREDHGLRAYVAVTAGRKVARFTILDEDAREADVVIACHGLGFRLRLC